MAVAVADQAPPRRGSSLFGSCSSTPAPAGPRPIGRVRPRRSPVSRSHDRGPSVIERCSPETGSRIDRGAAETSRPRRSHPKSTGFRGSRRPTYWSCGGRRPAIASARPQAKRTCKVLHATVLGTCDRSSPRSEPRRVARGLGLAADEAKRARGTDAFDARRRIRRAATPCGTATITFEGLRVRPNFDESRLRAAIATIHAFPP